MKFTIDFNALFTSLPVMLYGMIGGMFVMFLLYCAVSLFFRVGAGRRGKAGD